MDLNLVTQVGKVDQTPQVTTNNGQKQAFFYFIINDRRQNANGQWVDVPMKVPILAKDQKADVVEQYVVAGQELTVVGRLLTEEINGRLEFCVFLTSVSFGFKPRPEGGNQYRGNPQGGNQYRGNPQGGNQYGGNPQGGNQYGGNPQGGGNQYRSNPQGGGDSGVGGVIPF